MIVSPISIGQKPQLFLDNHIIEMVNFVTRTMHQPKKHDHNPLIKKDKPWEIVPYFRTNTWNLHWDSTEKLFKFWYEDMGWDYDEFMRLERTLPPKSTQENAAMETFEKTVDNRAPHCYNNKVSKEG